MLSCKHKGKQRKVRFIKPSTKKQPRLLRLHLFGVGRIPRVKPWLHAIVRDAKA